MRALILVVLATTAQAKTFQGSDDCLTCEMVDGELVLAVSHDNFDPQHSVHRCYAMSFTKCKCQCSFAKDEFQPDNYSTGKYKRGSKPDVHRMWGWAGNDLFTSCHSGCDYDLDNDNFPCEQAYDGKLHSQVSCRTMGQREYSLTLDFPKRNINGVRMYISDNGGEHSGFSSPKIEVNGRVVGQSCSAFGRLDPRHCGGCCKEEPGTDKWVDFHFEQMEATSVHLTFAGANMKEGNMFIVHEVQVRVETTASPDNMDDGDTVVDRQGDSFNKHPFGR